jgi:tetratricopeptide (TPR) repeat protein
MSRPLRRLGQLDRAEASVREALAIDDAVLDRDDGRRQNHLNALMSILRARRDYPGAMEASRESLRVARAAYGDEHPEVATGLNAVGFLLTVMGDYAGAVDALREAVRLREKINGPENLQTAVVRGNYGDALARGGDPMRGEAELRRALATYRGASTRDPEGESNTLEKLARWHLDTNDARALAGYERVADVAAALGPRGAAWKVRAAAGRGRALLLKGRVDEARDALEEATRLAGQAPSDPEQAVEIQLARSQVARRLDRPADARAMAAESLQSMTALPCPPARLRAFAEQVGREVGLPSNPVRGVSRCESP